MSLIVGFAVLLAVLAAVAWRLIGATLRPVEALRAGAERITGSGSAETLPLPDSADEIRRLAETLNDMLGRLETSRRGSARSSPTPRTNCARRWRACKPSWTWPWRPAASRTPPICWPRCSG